MATKTVTIDTDEWIYIDATGIGHTITNAQDFTTTLTDNSETDVQIYVDATQDGVTTTDGYVIDFQPEADQNSTARYIGSIADTADTVLTHGLSGEFVCKCPTTGLVQRWKPAQVTLDDVDAPTALTATRFEDQFGNVMAIPNTGSGITIA